MNSRPPRAPIVTDRNNPNPHLGTTLPREVHIALELIASKHGLSKSAYLRKLVIEHVGENGWVNR